ncbi:MAG: creatininase family protein [Candidatus Omnitrophica bacterium]|nr:creatininase family protein [Candidatus Omnitrophota bacterium]
MPKKQQAKITRPYLWQNLTVEEIRTLINRGCRTVLVPLGVVEQHGYHLTTFTDCHLAWEISVRIARKSDCFVAPLYPYLFSGGTLPGTINVSPETVVMVISDISDSLFSQGILNVLFILGHGGSENYQALMNFKHLYFHKRPHFADRLMAVIPVWELSSRWSQECKKKKDFHAGEFETSLMLALAAKRVHLNRRSLDKPALARKMREDPDWYQKVEKALNLPWVAPHVSQRPEIKVGVMGDPFLASRSLGGKLVKEIVTTGLKLLKQVTNRKIGQRIPVVLTRHSIF